MRFIASPSNAHRPAARALSLLALTTLAFGGMALTGCKRGGEDAPTKATAATAQSLAPQVSVVAARRQSLSDTVDVTGALNALTDVTVGVKLAGKIEAVYVREGDRVTAGQIVAQQDTSDYRAQLDQQRANLGAAQAKLDQANVAYANAQTTLKWTDEQTRSAVRLAQAALQAAKDQESIVKQGARPQEIEQAQENVAAAKADQVKARSDLKRYQDLYREQAVSAQQLDQAQAVADSADARYNAAMQALSLTKEGSRPQEIRRAEAAVEQARQNLITAQSNRDQVNLRRADVENARVGIASAQAGVKQAQAALRLAQQALDDTAVRSPINGVVAERKAEPGMQLGAGKDVARIVALDSIYFDAQLSETQYMKVRIGQTVTVTVDALPGRIYQAAVTKIYPVASSTARSLTVRISLRNPDNSLRPQLFARGQIVLATHPDALVVPREAALDYDGKTGRLFVVVNKTVQERKVKTGFATLAVVEILDNLQESDKVVTVGQAQIQNGDKVEIVAASASATP